MSTLVLVVEDDSDAQEIYVACLRHGGFRALVAGSARQAAELAQRIAFAAVVLDRRLPDRDGLDLARQWRASAGRMSKIPIVALTAFSSRADVEAALFAGCDAFLAKPCPGHVLVAHVAKLVIAHAKTGPRLRFDLDAALEEEREASNE